MPAVVAADEGAAWAAGLGRALARAGAAAARGLPPPRREYALGLAPPVLAAAAVRAMVGGALDAGAASRACRALAALQPAVEGLGGVCEKERPRATARRPQPPPLAPLERARALLALAALPPAELAASAAAGRPGGWAPDLYFAVLRATCRRRSGSPPGARAVRSSPSPSPPRSPHGAPPPGALAVLEAAFGAEPKGGVAGESSDEEG